MLWHDKWLAMLLAFCVGCAASVAGAAYPEHPIRLIVAYPAGASTNDILGRALAERLSRVLQQNVVVDNRPGAGGTIGTALVAQAEPDGYTLLLGANGPMSISPHVLRLSYDPRRDFEPITMFAVVPYVIVINAAVPATNLQEFIALAKAKPGELKFASAGVASTPHLCGELLEILKQGVEIMTLGPQPFAKFIADELERWGGVIRKSGIKIR